MYASAYVHFINLVGGGGGGIHSPDTLFIFSTLSYYNYVERK